MLRFHCKGLCKIPCLMIGELVATDHIGDKLATSFGVTQAVHVRKIYIVFSHLLHHHVSGDACKKLQPFSWKVLGGVLS